MLASASSHTVLLPWQHDQSHSIPTYQPWFMVCAQGSLSVHAYSRQYLEYHRYYVYPEGLSPYVPPVKLHAEIKAFSLFERRKMMAGVCYCKWGFKTRFKNQPSKKTPNLNERQERVFGVREKWCARARLAFWKAYACSLFLILFAEMMKNWQSSTYSTCDLGDLLWNPSSEWLRVRDWTHGA